MGAQHDLWVMQGGQLFINEEAIKYSGISGRGTKTMEKRDEAEMMREGSSLENDSTGHQKGFAGLRL